jgi:hypothetical protein
MKFRKKLVVIEAVQWTGDLDALRAWCEPLGPFPGGLVDGALTIETLEGEHRASVGDWIIRGVAGEFYPCKPDIFAATYEAVDGPRHYPPGMGEESRRLHREYNALVEAQRNGAKNGAEVVKLTDECNAKGIILVPGGENL